MHGTDTNRQERVLDPVARISEILFGLIMALTFTGSISVAAAGREEVRTLLVGAIGCNIAWGIVDAVGFLIGSLVERGRGLVTIRAVRLADSPEQAHHVIDSALSSVLTASLTKEDFEGLRQGVLRAHDLPAASLTKKDWLGALSVFLMVVLSTFPIVIPFLVFRDVQFALRTSNTVAIVMLFACGYLIARYAGLRPWRTGLSLVLLGVVLVGITIALGG